MSWFRQWRGRLLLSALIVLLFFGGDKITAAASGNVYQKLQTKEAVRVAVLGDSIGAGAGAATGKGWVPLVQQWMQERYGCDVTLDNYSVGGTTSFYGYYMCKTAMQVNVNEYGAYDLVIICYGQNDAAPNFGLVYEAMLREVKMLNPDCQILTLLEHSQRKYTAKIKKIIGLSKYYGADVVDMIAAYANSGYSYEQLCYDEVHPNEAGHLVYRDAVNGMIHHNVTGNRQSVGMPAPENRNISMFSDYEYISIEECPIVDGIITVPVTGSTVGVIFRYSPESRDVILNFSNGQSWFGPAHSIYDNVPRGVLANLCVPQGTTISIDDRDGKMRQTIYGFVFAGSAY